MSALFISMLLCILEQFVIGDLGIAFSKRLVEKWAKIMCMQHIKERKIMEINIQNS